MVPMRLEIAQTGAFLAATWAVMGNGAGRQWHRCKSWLKCSRHTTWYWKIEVVTYIARLCPLVWTQRKLCSQWDQSCADKWAQGRNPSRKNQPNFAPKTAPKSKWDRRALRGTIGTHGTKSVRRCGTQYHQTQQNSTLTHKFWISHNPEVAGSSPVSATNRLWQKRCHSLFSLL